MIRLVPPTKGELLQTLPLAAAYSLAVLVFVTPLSTWVGVCASLVGASVGLFAAGPIGQSRVRLVVVQGCGLLAAALGVTLDWWIGRWMFLPRVLGLTLTSYLLDACLFGLLGLSLVLVLRVSTRRVAILGLLEAGVLASSAVLLFANHRDLRLGQPRWFSDWAFTRSWDPANVLFAVGLLVLGVCLLMVKQRQDARRTLATVALLLVGLWIGVWVVGLLPGHPAASPEQYLAEEKSDEPSPGPVHEDDEQENGMRDLFPDIPPRRPLRGRPVALVEVHDEFEPCERSWYLRQSVRSQYDGRRLVGATLPGVDIDVAESFPTKRTTLTQLHAAEEISRVVPSTAYLLCGHSRPICLPAPLALEPRENPNPTYFRLSYQVWSRVLAAENLTTLYQRLGPFPGEDPQWPEAVRRHYLQGPDDPRYRELADRILREKGPSVLPGDPRPSALARALSLSQWLGENTTYSSMTAYPGDDPVGSFLFGDRWGRCVHLAHAVVYLCRSLGIPARVALGYAVPVECASQAGRITVLDTDAHAWPEIYLHGAGWVIVDVAAQAVDPHERHPLRPGDGSTAVLWRAATTVDNPVPFEPESGFTVPLPNWQWLMLAGTLTLYGIKFWRRIAPRYAAEDERYRLCYRAVMDRLAEVGRWRRFGETREAFADRLEETVPELQELTKRHVQHAVGQSESTAEDEWLELMSRAEQRITAITPPWRRALAWLHPVAWLWVR